MLHFAPKASYSRQEVLRLLAVTERQLKRWERNHWIQPAEVFVFEDLIALRTLSRLLQDRVSPRRISVAVAAVRKHLAQGANPLRELKIVAHGRRINVEVNGQRMDAVSGQLLLDFDRKEINRLLAFPKAKSEGLNLKKAAAEDWFQRGLEHEQSGAVKDAIRDYQTAVQIDPGSAGAWLNLGTIYFNARQFTKAEAAYKGSLAANPEYALAHFNIANLYDERGDRKRAVEHYEKALKLCPGYSDVHYNLALLFQSDGKVMEAVRHWKLYLKHDPTSSWGAIARRELEKLRKSTVLPGLRAGNGNAAVVADR